jgi:hypothetical protein
MDFLNEIGTQYEGLITLASSIFGLAGFIFGMWRYLKERKVRRDLETSQKKLDAALLRLKHLGDFASDLPNYKRAV